jgi:hypothetical protein
MGARHGVTQDNFFLPMQITSKLSFLRPLLYIKLNRCRELAHLAISLVPLAFYNRNLHTQCLGIGTLSLCGRIGTARM